MPTDGENMNLQSKNISKHWATIVVFICSIFLVSLTVFQFGFGHLLQLKARSRPLEFSGDWAVVGIQGDSRTTITFMPNGRLDANDGFTGKWWFESDTIHTQWWKADPPSLIEYVFPNRDEFVFTITHNKENLPSVMQGVYVVLTPSSSRNQQRTSPNKAVNPRHLSERVKGSTGF